MVLIRLRRHDAQFLDCRSPFVLTPLVETRFVYALAAAVHCDPSERYEKGDADPVPRISYARERIQWAQRSQPSSSEGTGKLDRGQYEHIRITELGDQAWNSIDTSVEGANPCRERRGRQLRVQRRSIRKPFGDCTFDHRHSVVGATVFRLESQTELELNGGCMTNPQKPVVRCAIYTRKSSEEGLEQSFNSLDAQREACEAFILSQRHEGWRLISTKYDDGGYSGGSIERPALKRLLEDVQAKKVNVIVVYKVDRLTRSLSDFARIVETLDARGVSFV